MPRVIFTPQLRRFVDAPEQEVAALTLRGLLEEAFAAQPRLRGYVLDEQGHLRPNIAVFVDGQRIVERADLSHALQSTSTVHVLQALSGG
jgi:sulfur-carrier protein